MEDIFTKITSLAQSSALDDEYYYQLIDKKINYLLDHEINQLFQLLYRIDLSEDQVKNAFKLHQNRDDISQHLTRLIIERLKQKIELRNRYSSKK